MRTIRNFFVRKTENINYSYFIVNEVEDNIVLPNTILLKLLIFIITAH